MDILSLQEFYSLQQSYTSQFAAARNEITKHKPKITRIENQKHIYATERNGLFLQTCLGVTSAMFTKVLKPN